MSFAGPCCPWVSCSCGCIQVLGIPRVIGWSASRTVTTKSCSGPWPGLRPWPLGTSTTLPSPPTTSDGPKPLSRQPRPIIRL